MKIDLVDICIKYISKNFVQVIEHHPEGFFLEEKLHDKLLEKLLAPNLGVILDDEKISVFIHEGTTSLKMSGASNFVTDKTLERIGKECIYLESISLFNCHNFSPKIAVQAFQNLKSLRFINLAKCAIAGKEVLNTIAENCPLLEGLILNRNRQVVDEMMLMALPKLQNLSELSLMGCKVTDKTLDCIAKYNQKINVLNLSRIIVENEKSLLNIIQSLKYLHTLNLTRIHCVTDETLKYITKYLPHIENLMLMHTIFSEEALTKMFKVCKNLREIALPSIPNRDKNPVHFFSTLAENCTKLELFSLPKVLKYDPEQLGNLAIKCNNLKSLYLTRTYISDSAINNILVNCKKLKELHIAHCIELTSNCFSNLVGYSNENLKILDLAGIVEKVLVPEVFDDFFSFCFNLRYFDISGTKKMDAKLIPQIYENLKMISTLVMNESSVTENDLKFISQCSRIHTLFLQGCSLSAKSLLSLSVLPRLSSLSTTNSSLDDILSLPLVKKTNNSVFKLLFKGMNLNPSLLKALIVAFPTVRYLNISANPEIGDESINFISLNLKNIQHLNISYNPKITDDQVLLLPSRCPMLHSLNLANTPITDKSASCVLTSLPLLQTVHFSSTKITDKGISVLENHPSKLQILAVSTTNTTASQLLKIQQCLPFLSIHARHLKDFSGKEEDEN